MMTGQMVWTVTYRVDSDSPQTELKRYTVEAATHFAQGIIDAGGVAVVTEEYEAEPAQEPETEEQDNISTKRKLQW
jgi:hypothetical protein